MKKETALQTISDLPKEFSLEDLLERFVFMEKVEKGLEEAKKRKTISHKTVAERFRKRWAK